MSDFLDRVAAAAMQKMVEVTGPYLGHQPRAVVWTDQPEEQREMWREAMRAAIAAMREPTEAMIEAAYSFNHPVMVEGEEVARITTRHEPADAWRAMIDAALTGCPCRSASEARPPTSEL